MRRFARFGTICTKNVKNTYEGVLLLVVKLQAEASYFTKSIKPRKASTSTYFQRFPYPYFSMFQYNVQAFNQYGSTFVTTFLSK